jgi:hypothetical protein
MNACEQTQTRVDETAEYGLYLANCIPVFERHRGDPGDSQRPTDSGGFPG